LSNLAIRFPQNHLCEITAWKIATKSVAREGVFLNFLKVCWYSVLTSRIYLYLWLQNFNRKRFTVSDRMLQCPTAAKTAPVWFQPSSLMLYSHVWEIDATMNANAIDAIVDKDWLAIRHDEYPRINNQYQILELEHIEPQQGFKETVTVFPN